MKSITLRYFLRWWDLLSVSAEYLKAQGLGCVVLLVGKRINLHPQVKTSQLPGCVWDNTPFLIISPCLPWWGTWCSPWCWYSTLIEGAFPVRCSCPHPPPSRGPHRPWQRWWASRTLGCTGKTQALQQPEKYSALSCSNSRCIIGLGQGSKRKSGPGTLLSNDQFGFGCKEVIYFPLHVLPAMRVHATKLVGLPFSPHYLKSRFTLSMFQLTWKHQHARPRESPAFPASRALQSGHTKDCDVLKGCKCIKW